MSDMLAAILQRASLSEGSLVGDRFRIAGRAATGGMGTVYRAHDLERDRPVALKIALNAIDHNLVARFEREAEVLSQLRHPNIVPFVTRGRLDNHVPFLVMEWLDGCDLYQRIQRGWLDESQTLLVARQACSALVEAHGRGLVHRDIKPANLFLVDGDLRKLELLDFGLVQQSTTAASLTLSGTFVGTPSFIAPEQAINDAPVDARADLYSLGAVLFTCLVGSPPFIAQQPVALLTKVLLEPAPRVSELRPGTSRAVDELIESLLAKEPDDRPDSADTLLRRLDELTLESGPSRARRRASTLSHREKTFFSVLLVDRAARHIDERLAEAMDAEASRCHARVHRLSNNALVAVFSSESRPTEMATMAAHCALLVHHDHADTSMAVATGRGSLDARAPVGEVIDRAIELLFNHEQTPVRDRHPTAGHPSEILLDEVTARLIERNFRLRETSTGSYQLLGDARGDPTTHRVHGWRTEFVGRGRELGNLLAILDECAERSEPRVTLVVGDEGMGKSRLAHELYIRLGDREDPFVIWNANGDPIYAESSFGILARILRAAMHVRPGDPLEVRQARILRHVAAHCPDDEVPRIAVFLGELMATPFESDDERAASVPLREARIDARLMGDHTRRAWEDWLEAVCSTRPVLCVIDDLQWADRPSVRYIDAALRHLENSRFAVLALATPAIDERFDEVWSEREVERFQLRPLARRACIAMARHAAAATASDVLDDALLERMVEQSTGNPLYLEEVLREAARGTCDEFPESLLALASGQLRQLSGTERRLLRAASVFGRIFWLEGVASLLGDDDGHVAPVLDRLCQRNLIVRTRRSRFPRCQAFRFRHEILRQAAYATFIWDDQLSAHQGAGRWLEGVGEFESAVLAEHHWRGGEPARAMPWYRRAAEQALEADDLDAAVERAEQALACGATGETRGALRLLQAEALNWKADHAHAAELAREGLTLLHPGSDPWSHCAHQLAWASYATGDVTSLDEVGDALVRESSPDTSDIYLTSMAICAANLALLKRRDSLEQILAVLEPRLLKRRPGRLLAGAVARMKGIMAVPLCRWGDTAAFMMDAVRIATELGHERTACHDELNLASSLSQLGEYAQSIAVVQSCLTRAARAGLEMQVFGNAILAMALARTGDVQEARRLFDSLASVETNQYFEATIAIYRAWFAVHTGQPEEATERLDRADQCADPDTWPHVHAFAMAVRSQALLDLERPDDALASSRKGMAVLESIGQLDEGDILLRVTHARALEASGHHGEARAAIRAAHIELRTRANEIDNTSWRHSYLHQVTENQAVIDLAEKWS